MNFEKHLQQLEIVPQKTTQDLEIPDGIRIIEFSKITSVQKLNSLIDTFNSWNEDLKRKRAFFGYEILDYLQPEAVIPVDNMNQEIPTELKKQTKKLGINFNSVLLEMFSDKQGVNPHTYPEVCGEKVYVYFHNEDCNLVLYKNPDPQVWEEHCDQRNECKQNEKEIEELKQKIELMPPVNERTLDQKKELRILREKLSTLKPPRFHHQKIELFIPNGSLLEMDQEFRQNWKICLPKRKSIIREKTVEKSPDYMLSTLTFCEYNPELIQEYVPREEE